MAIGMSAGYINQNQSSVAIGIGAGNEENHSIPLL